MNITGMVAITQRGGKPLLYLTRSDTPKVQVLDMNGETVGLSGGEYKARPVLGRNEESEKRGLVFMQEGTCASGTMATATVTFILDEYRRLIYPLRGPFDVARGILFYQELPPIVATFRECSVSLIDVLGVDVELGKQRLTYSERD